MQKQRIEYQLFEKNTGITYENVGLGISANIFHILKEWGIFEQVKHIGAPINYFHFVDRDLNYIKSSRIEKPALSVNRNLFYSLVSKSLNKECINLGLEKSANDFNENDSLISAEGINSKIRNEAYPYLKLRESNQILYLGISEATLGDQFKNSYHKRSSKKVDPVVFQSWWFGKLLHQNNRVLDKIIKVGVSLTPK